MSRSAYLSALQRRGLGRVGDVLIPGGGEFPSFSASGVRDQVDRMLAYMYPGDRDGVKMLLSVCGVLPKPLVRGLMALSERHRAMPEPIAAVLRLLNTGIKGVVMTLYYSDIGMGPSIHALIGYDAKVVTAEHASPGEVK
jgi:hypothetical protein